VAGRLFFIVSSHAEGNAQRILAVNTERAWTITLAEIRDAMRYKTTGTNVKDSDDIVIERFVARLAKEFAVSPIAMRIRLENLGFVVREDLPTLFGL